MDDMHSFGTYDTIRIFNKGRSQTKMGANRSICHTSYVGDRVYLAAAAATLVPRWPPPAFRLWSLSI